MNDVLPQEESYWNFIEETTRKAARDFDFSRIRTSLLEQAQLFSQDREKKANFIENKLYAFNVKEGEVLVLRPEETLPIIRSYVEHGMKNATQPVKLFYIEPFFHRGIKAESPDRQFYQIGFETLGMGGSAVDAELIQVAHYIFTKLGIEGIVFQLNSLGDNACRPLYIKKFQEYLRTNSSSLCKACRQNSGGDILNVFECQEEKCLRVARVAPKMIDALCDPCRIHFKEVLELLDETEIPYKLNPFIVRGSIDYYTRTVFEIWLSLGEEGFVLPMIGGGGRYDELAQRVYKEEVLGSGFAFEIERMIAIIKERRIAIRGVYEKPKSIFLAQLGFAAKKKSLRLFMELLKEGIPVTASFARDSLSSQLRLADAQDVDYALILGEKELIEKSIILRNMKTENQEVLEMRNLTLELKNRLGIV